MRGLSLIELLVVLLVLSLASFVAISNAPRLSSDTETEAQRFAVRLQMVEDAAAISAKPVRIVYDNRGYAFEEYASPDWRPVRLGRIPAQTQLPGGMTLSLTSQSLFADNEERLLARRPSQNEEAFNNVVIDPAGLPIVLSADFIDRGRGWRVTRSAAGAIEVLRARR